MKRLRLFRSIQVKLILMVLLLILIAVQLIGVYFISTMKNSLIGTFTSNLDAQATLLAGFVAPVLSRTETAESGGNSADELGTFVRNLFASSGTEIQVLDANGKVLTTSDPSRQSIVGRKNTSLLVSRALQGIRDNSEEFVDENNVRHKVVVKPVMSGDKVVGAVYVVRSMAELYDTMERVNRIFVSGILLALGLTAVLGVLLAGTITQPVKALTRQAVAVAEGRFEERVPVQGDDELSQLSAAFNEMTARLSEALAMHEEEKERLASILANMSDGVLATDERGRVIVANRRARKMLGRDDLEGRAAADVLQIGEEPIDAALRGRESTLLMRRKDEETEEQLVFRVTLTPIRSRDRGAAGAIVVLHDVTEMEKLEEARREFVANVSHELRTPLTTIKSYVEALEDGAINDPPLAGRFVGVIRNETERMIRLVSDLLHLSRFDSRQAQLHRERIDVNDMLDEVVDRFSLQLRQKAIVARVRVEPGIEPVWLDRDGIDQVLDNLISNAIKYTPDGGEIEITARIGRPDPAERRPEEGRDGRGPAERSRAEALPEKLGPEEARATESPAASEAGAGGPLAGGPEALIIVVRDTGVGIPKKDLGRIFERFYRVDKARSRSMGGTGLGLSIAREIVRAHGGTITIDSEVGKGTAVTVALPLVRQAPAATRPRPEEGAVRHAAPEEGSHGETASDGGMRNDSPPGGAPGDRTFGHSPSVVEPPGGEEIGPWIGEMDSGTGGTDLGTKGTDFGNRGTDPGTGGTGSGTPGTGQGTHGEDHSAAAGEKAPEDGRPAAAREPRERWASPQADRPPGDPRRRGRAPESPETAAPLPEGRDLP